MYSPDPVFLPFIKAVDEKVRAVANKGIKTHGKRVNKVATQENLSDSSLKKQFDELLLKKFDTTETMKDAVVVYNELVRKLCNTHLNKFIDCYRQISASK